MPLIPCSCSQKPIKISDIPISYYGNGFMPPKFGAASGGSMFSNARKVYTEDAGGGKNYHPSSSYTYLKKITAIGKSSKIVPYDKVNKKRSLAFSKINKNDVKSALTRVRSGGTTYRSKKYSQL